MSVRTLLIDGKTITIPGTMTLLQACEEAGIEIPRFCFHERLSIAGNCRMCLVEVAGEPKPVASCSRLVRDLRPTNDGSPSVIRTCSEGAKNARHGILEFLLLNHPLDCPICDQGGECDLQDQVMAYGKTCSRFNESKRAVEEKYFGPLIKTDMTRCIHCTRCVRFMTEVAGTGELGTLNRGHDMEITSYLNQTIRSELQGNIIDLCPVGALTSRPYAFSARSWELRRTESIDVMDALGANICIESRGQQVMRITPRLCEAINEEWLADKSRFCVDGLASSRLDRPLQKVDTHFESLSWSEALSAAARRLQQAPRDQIQAIVGDLASIEEQFALRLVFSALGSDAIECRQDSSCLSSSDGHAGYLFNPGLEAAETSDAIVLIGSTPRIEAPLLNARLRKAYLRSGARFGVIGDCTPFNSNSGYPIQVLGETSAELETLVEGKLPFFQTLKSASRPLIILGQGALVGPGASRTMTDAARLADRVGALHSETNWNGFAVLHTAAARVGGLFLNLVSNHERSADSPPAVRVLLGADELSPALSKAGYTIYIGSHGDQGARQADLILPSAAFSEQAGWYLNTEGRLQETIQAISPPGDAKPGWEILGALGALLNTAATSATSGKSRSSLAKLRADIRSEFPDLPPLGDRISTRIEDIRAMAARSRPTLTAPVPYRSTVDNYFQTNPIARASAVLQECATLSRARTVVPDEGVSELTEH